MAEENKNNTNSSMSDSSTLLELQKLLLPIVNKLDAIEKKVEQQNNFRTYTIKEVAGLTGWSERKIRYHVEQNNISSVRIGSSIEISHNTLQSLINNECKN